MIKHIVLFKFKEGVSGELIQSLGEELMSLKGKISSISEFVWGENVSPEHRNEGYTHGFIMTLGSEKEIDAYLVHPAHTACVREYLDPIREDVLVFDIEE